MEGNANRKKILTLTAVVIAALLALALFWFTQLILSRADEHDPSITEDAGMDNNGAAVTQEVIMSHSPGFYESGINLEMYAPEGCEVLYTVTLATGRSVSDGRVTPTGESYMFIGGLDPDPDNICDTLPDSLNVNFFNTSDARRQTFRYSQPLELANNGNFTALIVSVKAALYKDGARITPVKLYTYILGSRDGDKSFSDIFGSMLINITIDEKLLYDYETGIFINGAVYDKAMAEGIAIDPWTPRNYNQRGKEWERLAYVDFFEKDGTLVYSTLCGVRVAGGTSRGATIKSLKLVADSGYGGDNRFYYPFFEGARDMNGVKIESFKKLVLRNARNDLGGSMIRDQLVHKLGGETGVAYQEGRNAVVYMNGKYYGLMCLHESLDADYMEDHYFVNKDNVASFLIRSDQYKFRYKQESGTEEQMKCFFSDMNYLIYNNFTDAKGMERIREVIDVEDFCRYMAFQIFIVNEDWPHNNVLVWRYYGPESDSVVGADGRWRFVLKDMDFGLVGPERDTFAMCLNDGLYNNEPCLGPVLKNLLKNAEFRDIFRQSALNVVDVLNSEHLLERIQEAIDEIEPDMHLYAIYNGMSVDGWLSYLENFKVFARERHDKFLRLLDIYVPAG
ncbi:MAG: CotH kinase family protein [Clostridia bacterium]|nr:CotH kinase family protein [Clostridia bacterium]